MRIGIEVELDSDCVSQYELCEENGLNFNSFVNVDDLDNVRVKMSEEYYNSTVEYNFTPFELKKSTLGDVTRYIGNQMSKYDLSLNGCEPAYTGTHVHLFDDFNHLDKKKILQGVMHFIIEHIDVLDKASMRRLLFGHQLWGNFSHRNNDKWQQLCEWLGNPPPFYHDAEFKNKYNPVIHSPESQSGKPESFEIRIIPNEFFMNGLLYDLLKEIKNGEIYKRCITSNTFFYTLGEKIGYNIQEYKAILKRRRERNNARNNSISDTLQQAIDRSESMQQTYNRTDAFGFNRIQDEPCELSNGGEPVVTNVRWQDSMQNAYYGTGLADTTTATGARLNPRGRTLTSEAMSNALDELNRCNPYRNPEPPIIPYPNVPVSDAISEDDEMSELIVVNGPSENSISFVEYSKNTYQRACSDYCCDNTNSIPNGTYYSVVAQSYISTHNMTIYLHMTLDELKSRLSGNGLNSDAILLLKCYLWHSMKLGINRTCIIYLESIGIRI